VELTEDKLKPGLILGRYELLAPVAKGGMAQVWIARLTGTRGFQKTVAIKTMLPHLSDDPEFEQMFLDEALLASRVRHPNVVEILDLGEDAGILYLVMEWIEGEPLSMLMKQALRQEGIPLPLAVRVVMQACAGLHAAHELKDDEGEPVGLVHRDISPQNILVSYDGVVKVGDFGVAMATGRASTQASAGQVKGKVPYMSPEQATGGVIDRRSDVFAMGILLYMMTTGMHPFRRENDAQTMFKICSDVRVAPPSAVVEDYPEELEEIVEKALAKSADQRFQTAGEMQQALDALPHALRAGTEEDLAAFMRSLLSERMEKRRALIQAALKDAETRSMGRRSIDVIDERSGAQMTPASGAGRVSNLDGDASLGTPWMSSYPIFVAGASERSPASVGTATSAKVPLRGILGALALSAAGALGVYLITQSDAPETPPQAAAQPLITASPAVEWQAPTVAPAPAPTTVFQVGDLEKAPESVADVELAVVPAELPAPMATEEKTAVPSIKSSPRAGAKSAASGKAKAGAQAASRKPFISPFTNPDF
jgi:serine/threonine protein kinase